MNENMNNKPTYNGGNNAKKQGIINKSSVAGFGVGAAFGAGIFWVGTKIAGAIKTKREKKAAAKDAGEKK